MLFRGKVLDMARRATEGFLRGKAEFTGLDEFRGETFSLDFQNEWLLGRRNGEVAVMVPDIVCVMDTVSGEAIGTEVLRYGRSAAPRFRWLRRRPCPSHRRCRAP